MRILLSLKLYYIIIIGIGSIENGQMGGGISSGYKIGNSLKCWNEYFSNAKIYGIDIYEYKEINTESVTTFVANQASANDLEYVINAINNKVDIIIDDGSHSGDHQVFSFMYLNNYLSDNGIYVIEDIQPHNIEQFKDLSIFPEAFRKYILQNFNIRIFDTRSIGHYDDFLMSFTRINRQQINKVPAGDVMANEVTKLGAALCTDYQEQISKLKKQVEALEEKSVSLSWISLCLKISLVVR